MKYSKDKAPLWRPAIFNLMHDSYSSIGWAGDIPAITEKIYSAVSKTVTEILIYRNLALRWFLPGTLLILETNSKDFAGEIKIPDDVLISLGIGDREKYSFLSLYNDRKYTVARGGKLSVKIDADGCDVLTSVKG